jgi:hypothetical protein
MAGIEDISVIGFKSFRALSWGLDDVAGNGKGGQVHGVLELAEKTTKQAKHTKWGAICRELPDDGVGMRLFGASSGQAGHAARGSKIACVHRRTNA